MKRIAEYTALILTLTLVGCATTSPQNQATDHLSDDRAQMDDVRGQVDRTMHSLDSLMRAPPAEIRTAQGQYATNVSSLRDATDALADSAKDLRARKIDYLTEWERAQLSVESAELKRAGEQRRKEVVQSLAGLESTLRQANESLGPLLSDLEDIEHVIGNDPTPAGVAAVRKSGIVRAARERAATANRRLDLAASRFDRALASLSPQPGTRPVTAGSPSPAGAAGSTGAVGAANSAGATAMPSFSQADRNTSGAIEQDEVGQVQGLDFRSADSDKDGKLSESEYEAARKARAPGGASSSTAR